LQHIQHFYHHRDVVGYTARQPTFFFRRGTSRSVTESAGAAHMLEQTICKFFMSLYHVMQLLLGKAVVCNRRHCWVLLAAHKLPAAIHTLLKLLLFI
jgi:hypothetical protein